ncbi:MAG TPA: EamA family transporter [Candidatus Xenobia bacterium]|nr:EamA family transporter [Candidatus Xenobia bacterium]
MHARHWMGFGAVALIWGTTWLAVRVVVLEMPPLSAAGLRFVVAALLLGAATRARGRSLSLARLSGSERRVLAWLTFLVIGIPYALVFYGEQTVSSALAAILFSVHPVFVLLFDSLRQRSNLFRGPTLAGLVLALAGICLIFVPRLTGPMGELLGALAIVAAALSAGLGAVVAKYGAHELDPWVGVTWQMGGAGVALLAFGFLLERPTLSGYSTPAWLSLAFLTVFGSCVAFVLYYSLLKRMKPIELATLSFIIPIIATVFGWLVLDERLGGYSLAGAAVALAGVALIHRRRVEPEPITGD